MKIAVLGGDERSGKLIELLDKEGHDLKVFAFDKLDLGQINTSGSLISAIGDRDIVIGPLPCSKDNRLLNTPFSYKEILIEEIFKEMKSHQIFIAGQITDEISSIANIYNISTIDLMDREELAVLNAIPTAEGGIQIAMEETKATIHGSNIMILGFGRIGKILAKMLQGIGANVFAGARSYSDLAWIKSYGYNPLHLDEIGQYLKNMDIVFNTIPSMILTRENLCKLGRESLVIDLASKPGGVDLKAAEEMEIRVISALGLPGKVAPETAAEIIKGSIYNIIGELGV